MVFSDCSWLVGNCKNISFLNRLVPNLFTWLKHSQHLAHLGLFLNCETVIFRLWMDINLLWRVTQTVQSAAPLPPPLCPSCSAHVNSSLFISCHFPNSTCCVLHTGPNPPGREGRCEVTADSPTWQHFKSCFIPNKSTLWSTICDVNLKVLLLLQVLTHNPARSSESVIL